MVNPVFCQLKGLSAEEIIGKTPQELDDYERAKEAAGLQKQPPRQRMLAAQGEEHHKRIMRTGETIEVEEAYPQPDGRVEYFHVVKTPVFDALGVIVGSQGVQFDITERRQAEQKLAESRNFLDRIINAVPDPIFVKDRQHRGVLINDAFCQLMRLKREELLGKTDHNHDFLTPAQADEFKSKDEQVFTTGKENINEETITAADGTVHFIITKKALYTGENGEKFIVGVIQDITERKRAELELESIHQRLVDVSRQAGMAEVATNVLHNVGNVLNSVNVSAAAGGGQCEKIQNLLPRQSRRHAGRTRRRSGRRLSPAIRKAGKCPAY